MKKGSIEKAKGFTLLEIMIVIAIIGILMAFALPSYRYYVLRSHRTEVRQTLLDVAQKMQQNYTLTRKFNQKPDGSAIDDTTLAGWGLDKAGEGGRTYYTIAFSAGPEESSYTVKATAVNGQEKDFCKSISLNQSNTRLANNETSPRSKDSTECWGH